MYSSMFSSARIGSPAATWPTSGRPLSGRIVRFALSKSSSIARGFEGSRLQQPDLLQVGQVRVHGRGRVQAHGFADLPHGRRVPGLRRVLADEVEDLLLPLGQIQINHR